MAAHIPAEVAAHIPAAAHTPVAVLHTPVAAVELHILAAVLHNPEGVAEGTLLVVLKMQKSSGSVAFPCLVQEMHL